MINSDIVTVLKKARTIRSQLEEMDQANAPNRRLSGLKEGTPATYRTRIAVTNRRRRKLKEIMMEFQALRQRMMTEYKDTVGRRYFTVTGEHPNEEIIEKIISNGGEEFLSKEIQEHGGGGGFLETVGEKMDDIEHHVLHASHYAKDGTKYLQTGKKYQKSRRKWMCIGLILLLILILVIVIPVATCLSSS
ncbi:hypothetical protein K1719_034028 [Acacia pycnantha]|nr:hypothetical protein K1719_034028 [Acacia pycnantha]